MTAKLFVDTNVLIYAHDRAAEGKLEIARSLLEQLWADRTGVLSLQILEELYVNLTRKVQYPLTRSEARKVVEKYAEWEIQLLDAEDVLAACRLEERQQLSFWDALLIVTAAKAAATTLLTEDLQHGRTILGVRIENPFRR